MRSHLRREGYFWATGRAQRCGSWVRLRSEIRVQPSPPTLCAVVLLRPNFPEGSPVGFVGDWHVHPQNVPPSSVDRQSIARLGRHYRRRVATVVVVREGKTWIPHGLVASRLRSWPCAVRVEGDRAAR